VNPADLQGLRSGDLETRETHLHRLLDRARTHGDESAIAALHALVRDYRDFHRSLYSRAMNQVAVFADAGLQEPLLAALADTRYNCQAWAAMGCAAMDIRAAVPQLVTLLDHSQWIVRGETVSALGRLGDASVVPALRPLLGDQADWLRQRTADALARIGGDAALEALWHEFEHRRFARIGYLASTLALFAPEVVPRLLAAADSTDPDQRYWAAVALGSTGDRQVVPTLDMAVPQISAHHGGRRELRDPERAGSKGDECVQEVARERQAPGGSHRLAVDAHHLGAAHARGPEELAVRDEGAIGRMHTGLFDVAGARVEPVERLVLLARDEHVRPDDHDLPRVAPDGDHVPDLAALDVDRDKRVGNDGR